MWSDVYNAYKLLKQFDVINSNTKITFPVRLLWSINSLNRLIWLQKFTNATLTVWSHHTDKLNSKDGILLFRKYFDKSHVYYDLQPEEHEFFNANAFNEDTLKNVLENSSNCHVKSFSKNENSIDLEKWETGGGEFYKCDHGAIVLNNGASFTSVKQYKVEEQEGRKFYTVSGNFEIFDSDQTIFNNKTNNCVKISMRTSKNQINACLHSEGSINIYLYTNGLIRAMLGDRVDSETNIQPSNHFEFSITDNGEFNEININISSFDSSFQKHSVQFALKSNYIKEQEFYVTQALIGDGIGLGINRLKI